jgi:hypothetical protein
MRKSQAAMEFLMTYGWAILIVVIAILTLAYFGVFDTSKWLGTNTCVLPSGLSCLDHSITFVDDGFGGHQNNLQLKIKNNLGKRIKITGVSIPQYLNKHEDYTGIMPDGGIVIAAGESPLISISDLTNIGNGGAVLPSGTQYKIEFTIELVNTDSSLPHQYQGTIKGKIN